jgi:hypothetical protein
MYWFIYLNKTLIIVIAYRVKYCEYTSMKIYRKGVREQYTGCPRVQGVPEQYKLLPQKQEYRLQRVIKNWNKK